MREHHNPAVPKQLAPSDGVDLYAQALMLSTQPRAIPVRQRLMNVLYWTAVLAAFAWVVSMAADRDPPVDFNSREIANEGLKVAPGQQILVRAERTRDRTCPLIKRQGVIDGKGRREDYEPEVFDAYGPVTPSDKPEIDITGPTLRLDAYPGRGRLITTLAWHCNALQRALNWPIVVVQVLEFEIVPRKQ